VLPLIREAADRVYSVVRETPLVPLPRATQQPKSGMAFAKLEQLQVTGSFKLRGATNKLMSLSPKQAAAGVITSSTGNHGLGVAAAARFLGIDAEVFLSAQVTQAKQEKIRNQGARVRVVGDDPLAAEVAAREAALETGRSYVSPYNDPYVVAGQGTVAVELLRQLPDMDAIFIATGGGGLMSGIGTLLHHTAPRTEVIGCWPENSAVLYESLKAGRIIMEGAPSGIDCTVRDLSIGGAGIHLAGRADLPGAMQLLIVSDGLLFDCALVWRQDDRVGLRFTSRRDLRSDADGFQVIRTLWRQLAARQT